MNNSDSMKSGRTRNNFRTPQLDKHIPQIAFSDVGHIYLESQNNALENDLPPKVRKTLWQLAREALRNWTLKEYSAEKVQKFICKINNGFDYWFTFVINPGVEPTNNRAERALRPYVVLRKILGTLHNDKGTSIHERIMTTLATWGQKGLNSLQMLTTKLAS